MRFLKLSAEGNVIAADATDHVAVRDTVTGLEWTVAETKAMKWKAAGKWAEKLELLGGGWRLPTVEELFGLADRTRHSPAIDQDAFPGCDGGWYWSATVDAESPSASAWYVYFGNGGSNWLRQNFEGRVRAVRAGQSLGLLAR